MIIKIEPELAARVERLVARAEGVVPLSPESVVHMALEAFLDESRG